VRGFILKQIGAVFGVCLWPVGVWAAGIDIACCAPSPHDVRIVAHAYRTGELLEEGAPVVVGTKSKSDLFASFKRNEVGGYYFAHDKLLIYINDLVDENEAMVDLTYDFKTRKGWMILRERKPGDEGRKIIFQGPAVCDAK